MFQGAQTLNTAVKHFIRPSILTPFSASGYSIASTVHAGTYTLLRSTSWTCEKVMSSLTIEAKVGAVG